ncbi:MAG: winged helix-turn-helix transcriptional regulator [Proteobacteria bacterium]|nr:winged helix-turn-helix transcriptional regulator [Pseudomonadota bacterium]
MNDRDSPTLAAAGAGEHRLGEAAAPGAAALDAEAEITLGLLTAVHEDRALTQRSASRRLGIALGLTNAYLKRCVRKGLIKVTTAPPNRYLYYLTPRGFAEKSRLTAQFFSQSFRFFRIARRQCDDMFARAAARGWRRLALAGISDLCDIALLCARAHEVTLVGVIDTGAQGAVEHAGLKVVGRPADLPQIDAILVTDFTDAQATFEALARVFAPDRILTLPMLAVVRERRTAPGAGPP